MRVDPLAGGSIKSSFLGKKEKYVVKMTHVPGPYKERRCLPFLWYAMRPSEAPSPEGERWDRADSRSN